MRDRSKPSSTVNLPRGPDSGAGVFLNEKKKGIREKKKILQMKGGAGKKRQSGKVSHCHERDGGLRKKKTTFRSKGKNGV